MRVQGVDSKKVIRVLIVEDESSEERIIRETLVNSKFNPYEVKSASSLDSAYKLLEENRFDLILLDLNIPGFSGLETLEDLNKKYSYLPIIVITGFYDEMLGIKAISMGAEDFFVKDKCEDYFLNKSVWYSIERKKIVEEFKCVKSECDLQRWGLEKTNESIKILYRELEKNNERLKELDRLKSEFVSMVSHELRTPLTAIKEGISIVLEGLAGEINEEQKEFLNIAKKNVDRLHRLINDVLSFSKLESGKMEFDMRKNSINRAIQESVELLVKTAGEKGLYINTELEQSLEDIEFDYDKIIQVITNLLNNAVKHTDKGGIIVRSSKDDKGRVIVVKVKDTGKGIKKEDIAKLFYKFQQLGGDKDRKVGGTGLGLAICRQIAERHGGKIWVESEYGNGSEFIFTLPIL